MNKIKVYYSKSICHDGKVHYETRKFTQCQGQTLNLMMHDAGYTEKNAAIIIAHWNSRNPEKYRYSLVPFSDER